MNQENDLDFDVLSQACLREPVAFHQGDALELAAMICFGDLRDDHQDDLDFDVLGQTALQDCAADQDGDGSLARVWASGLRKCGRTQPYYRMRSCCGNRAQKRKSRVASFVPRETEYWRQRVAGAQDPPS